MKILALSFSLFIALYTHAQSSTVLIRAIEYDEIGDSKLIAFKDGVVDFTDDQLKKLIPKNLEFNTSVMAKAINRYTSQGYKITSTSAAHSSNKLITVYTLLKE